jgi:uncharacterized membrane protein
MSGIAIVRNTAIAAMARIHPTKGIYHKAIITIIIITNIIITNSYTEPIRE